MNWKYSKQAMFEMGLLDDAFQPYPRIIPESWKEYEDNINNSKIYQLCGGGMQQHILNLEKTIQIGICFLVDGNGE